MSTAIVVPDTFKGPVASVFQGQQAVDDLSAGISGGYGLIGFRGKVWTIRYQGNSMTLMRPDGDGPKGSIEVVIVKANPQLSKTFYINGWDENNNNPPDCASANGITPDAGVPHKQNDICATCPKNAWGSAPGGGKGKACGDHRRMAAVPVADLRNEALGGPLLLRCPAASLQDLSAFNQRYAQLGYPYFSMAIKISFDPAESFPKFKFEAIRPLTEDEAKIVVELQNSPSTMRVVSETVVQAAPQVAHQPATFLEAPPANAVAPQPAPATQVSPQPAVAPVAAAPVAQPVQAAQPVQPSAPVQGGGNGAGVAGEPVAAPQPAPVAQPAPVTNGFGAVQPASGGTGGGVGPAAQQAAPAQASPVKMTGFGAATPEGNPSVAPGPAPVQAAQPAPAANGAAPAGPTPGVVTAFEGSIDDRLAALLG